MQSSVLNENLPKTDSWLSLTMIALVYTLWWGRLEIDAETTLWFNWEQHAWKNVCGEKKTAVAFAVSVCAFWVGKISFIRARSACQHWEGREPPKRAICLMCVWQASEMCTEVRARWPLSSHSNEVIILSCSRSRRFSLEFFALRCMAYKKKQLVTWDRSE